MAAPAKTRDTAVHDFNSLAFVGTDFMQRDKEQSHLLHQPEQMISSVDPMTGREIEDLEGHPFIVDGNLVIYFESEKTRQEYMDMPIDHPVPLPDNPYEDWVAEG